MAWFCSGSTNRELIENLYREELIKSERVKNAMLMVNTRAIPPNILNPSSSIKGQY